DGPPAVIEAADEGVVAVGEERSDVHPGHQVIDGVALELPSLEAPLAGREHPAGGGAREVRPWRAERWQARLAAPVPSRAGGGVEYGRAADRWAMRNARQRRGGR